VQIGTGTEVMVNPARWFVPVLGALWFLMGLRRRHLHLVPSASTGPCSCFWVRACSRWDWQRCSGSPGAALQNILLVQLAQWAIFAIFGHWRSGYPPSALG